MNSNLAFRQKGQLVCHHSLTLLFIFYPQKTPFSYITLFSVQGYIPAPFEDARFRKPEKIIIKAHFLLRVIQENTLRMIAPA